MPRNGTAACMPLAVKVRGEERMGCYVDTGSRIWVASAANHPVHPGMQWSPTHTPYSKGKPSRYLYYSQHKKKNKRIMMYVSQLLQSCRCAAVTDVCYFFFLLSLWYFLHPQCSLRSTSHHHITPNVENNCRTHPYGKCKDNAMPCRSNADSRQAASMQEYYMA